MMRMMVGGESYFTFLGSWGTSTSVWLCCRVFLCFLVSGWQNKQIARSTLKISNLSAKIPWTHSAMMSVSHVSMFSLHNKMRMTKVKWWWSIHAQSNITRTTMASWPTMESSTNCNFSSQTVSSLVFDNFSLHHWKCIIGKSVKRSLSALRQLSGSFVGAILC